MATNADARLSWEAPCATGEARSDAANGGDPTALTMRVMAEAVEPRARVYIYAHRNEVWENRDKLRRRGAAQLQDQSSGFCLAPRTGPRCTGVLWASLVLTARCVQSSSSLLKAGLHCIFCVPRGAWRYACSIKETRRYRAARERQSRASSRSGRRYRLAPPGAMPAAGIGLELVASITMPSTAHLPMSELGDLSLPRGREGVPQRLLRHRAGPTHQLGGVRYAVDRGRPPSPPGRAGTRGYLREPQTHA